MPTLPPRITLGALLTLMAFVGCSSATSIEDLPPELQAASVVSTRGPGAPLASSGRWSFLPGSRIVADPQNRDAPWVEQQVRNALIDSLSGKNWTLDGIGGSEMQLGYMIAVDDEMDDAALAATFGLSPGLAADSGRYSKGTLVVELRRPGVPMPLWRGSIQILADPTLSRDLRIQRIQNGVASIVSRMPIEG